MTDLRFGNDNYRERISFSGLFMKSVGFRNNPEVFLDRQWVMLSESTQSSFMSNPELVNRNFPSRNPPFGERKFKENALQAPAAEGPAEPVVEQAVFHHPSVKKDHQRGVSPAFAAEIPSVNGVVFRIGRGQGAGELKIGNPIVKSALPGDGRDFAGWQVELAG
jgi:hypothetical protein